MSTLSRAVSEQVEVEFLLTPWDNHQGASATLLIHDKGARAYQRIRRFQADLLASVDRLLLAFHDDPWNFPKMSATTISLARTEEGAKLDVRVPPLRVDLKSELQVQQEKEKVVARMHGSLQSTKVSLDLMVERHDQTSTQQQPPDGVLPLLELEDALYRYWADLP